MKWQITTEALEDPFANYDWSDPDFCYEMIRLAKLGMWADKHGIPAIENARFADWSYGNCGPVGVAEVLYKAFNEISTYSK